MATALSGYLYSIPFSVQRLMATWLDNSGESSSGKRVRQKNDTNRMIFFAAGPVALFLGLMAAEPVFKFVLGVSYFLTPVSLKLLVTWMFIVDE